MAVTPLIERLCHSLAFHLVETELTIQFADGDVSDFRAEIEKAKALIVEAGFDMDELYPVAERPTAMSEQ